MVEFDTCKKKALSLPLSPGVYIMRDRQGTVIYVGKAKKLKNRVTQYFQETASHSPKTRLMVSKIADFDVIVAGSEFEALVLECSLIKRYLPKYNILLKDDKGYPYVRLDMHEAYPKMSLANRVLDDGAAYYGPFGSRNVTRELIDTISVILNLPQCTKHFPKGIGKGRPCLHYHMGQCAGWCMGKFSQEDYHTRIRQARLMLEGNFKAVTEAIRRQMLSASEEMNFELAAKLRDRMQAVEKLGQKQTVTARRMHDTDVIGYAETEIKASFTILHFKEGNLVDKTYQIFPIPENREEAVLSLLAQYYTEAEHFPKQLLLPFSLSDSALLSEYVRSRCGNNMQILVPQRGENKQLSILACKNAREEAERATAKEEHYLGKIHLLSKMLGIATAHRIESFDISNLGDNDIVAGMVVFSDGRPKKSEYKKFHIEGLSHADDYESMLQAVTRRFLRYQNGDKGFSELPDLILIDGGATHAATAKQALDFLGIAVPVFGMVKDDRHRTRALVTPEGAEIRIDAQQSVFSFVGSIQEETHRFAITYQKNLRSKRLKYSELDKIPGIGSKRKQDLLKHFKSLTAISEATVQELSQLLPKNAATAVYDHFHKTEGE